MLRLVVLAVLATGCQLVFPLDDPDASAGDAPPTDDANACGAELDTDPANCGSCEHSCGGGACKAGLCQPVELTTRSNPIADIEVTLQDIYWIEGGLVRRMSKNGGSVATLTGPDNATAIAVDLLRLYWIQNGVVMRCLQTACTQGEVVNGLCTSDGQLASGNDFVGNTCTDTKDAFRTDKQTKTVLPIASSLNTPAGIAVFNNDVFVADRGADRLLVSRDGANPESISNSDTDDIDQLAVDVSNVYWTANNMIGAANRNDTTSTIQLTTANMPEALAAADGNVYFVGGRDTGYLKQVNDSGVTTDLIPSLDVPVSVAVDGTFVYVLTSPGGTNRILKVAR